MVPPHTTPADLAAAAASLLWWPPRSPGEQLGVEPFDRERVEFAPNPDECQGGFVATVLSDEHGASFLGWIYEGWLFVGDAGSDLLAGKPGPCDQLESQLGPRCLRVHASASVPPWVRVTVEFRSERTSAGLGPYRVAAPRPVWDGDDTRCEPMRPLWPVVKDSERIPGECLVVIYTKEPTLLGKRFMLEHPAMRIGRGADNHIVLDGDSVSRRHAHVERRAQSWVLIDLDSANGTYCNDEQIAREIVLKNGDRVNIGPTIFKFLAGPDLEAQYHEEIYRMTIMDGLTQLHNKRYFYEALDREIIRGRRHEQALSILLFDIDHFKRINDAHGHLAGDFVLKELARVVQARIGRDDVLARYGGEEFALILPRSPLAGTTALAETLRQHVSDHVFTYRTESMTITIRTGTALLQESDRGATDLIKRAAEQLDAAKIKSPGPAGPLDT